MVAQKSGRISICDFNCPYLLDTDHPETNQFSVGISTRQKDYIILKAMEKPLINVLWLGTLMVMTGFGVAIARRYREFTRMKLKGQE